ncbi:zinc finger protein ZFPM1-like isoform X2 [Lineus longissimus]|uniref:zinc finger protein ZFPM1-like isoform X2 n=1 Tax=Lineus longissimus TaxID=88925 RepID=UPI002B4EDAC0
MEVLDLRKSSSKRQMDGDPDELAKEVNLPPGILVLKQNGDRSSFSVCTTIPLPKASSFGPFKIREVVGEGENDNIMTFPGPGSEEVTVAIETETGYWLRLVHIATDEKPEETNAVINIQGDLVCCEVTKDIPQDTELVAMITREDIGQDEGSEEEIDVAMETVNDAVAGIPTPDATPAVPHPLIFGCPHCGVRFSSPRTLQGHITYYCSKRPVETSGSEETNQISPGERKRTASIDSREEDATTVRKRSRQPSSSSSHERTSPMVSPGGFSKHSLSSPPLPDTEKIKRERRRTYSNSSTEAGSSDTTKKMGYKCPQCAYTADKKNSLHSHMRNMHKASKDDATTGGTKIDDLVTAPDMYCVECKIQFSSRKTYQGHKEFYCGKRQKQAIPEDFDDVDIGRSGSSSDGQSPNAVLSPAMPPGPVLIPPGCHSTNGQPVSAMTLPGSLASQPTVIFTGPIMTAPGPAGLALTMPTVIMQPLFLPSSLHGHHGLTSALGIPDDKPLDLSVKKDSPGTKVDNSMISHSDSRENSPLDDHDTPTDLSIKRSRKDGEPTELRDTVNKPLRSSQSPVNDGHIVSNAPCTPSVMEVGAAGTVNLPQNLSICSECNIVFYKHENFLIHKQFYCSGRKTKLQTVEEPESPRKASSSHHLNENSKLEQGKRKVSDSRSPPAACSPPLNEHVLQFSCTPCKIKFSSLSTLEAHQKYYCPYRPQLPELRLPSSGTGTPVDGQTSDEDSNTAMPHVCQKCGNEYPTARLLKVHLCQSSNKPGIWNLLRCSQCSFVTHKESQYSDHVRKHSSVKGFRCSLCGYKGNTIRGMRMHGKMHVDKGEPFTDDHMVVLDSDESNCQDDISNPIISSDIESEIMRLKNEPYKRRRSRYKRRVEENHRDQNLSRELPKTDALFVCGMCNAPFTDCNALGQHMQKHLEARPHKCSYCGYSTTVQSHLEKHIKLIHKVEASSHEDTDNPVCTLEDNARQNCAVSVKKETESELDQRPKVESSSPPSPSENKSEIVASLLRKIKQEPREINTKSENDCDQDVPKQNEVTPPDKAPLSPGNPPESNRVKEGTCNSPSPVIVNGSGKPNFRYCNHCDISFMYLSSFVAHKKYYCNASIRENLASENELVVAEAK